MDPASATPRPRLPAGEFTTFTIADADSYFDAAAAQGIQLDRQHRRSLIAAAVQKAAANAREFKTAGTEPLPPGIYEWEPDEDLLDEVTDLVEAPQAVLGSFEQRFLDLPQPILTAVMKKHQRYFPVLAKSSDPDGTPSLAPRFVTVANADALEYPDVVRQGNESVIRARYADAEFFYKQDSARPLDSYTQRLETLTFHTKLGSMLEKSAAWSSWPLRSQESSAPAKTLSKSPAKPQPLA